MNPASRLCRLEFAQRSTIDEPIPARDWAKSARRAPPTLLFQYTYSGAGVITFPEEPRRRHRLPAASRG